MCRFADQGGSAGRLQESQIKRRMLGAEVISDIEKLVICKVPRIAEGGRLRSAEAETVPTRGDDSVDVGVHSSEALSLQFCGDGCPLTRASKVEASSCSRRGHAQLQKDRGRRQA